MPKVALTGSVYTSAMTPPTLFLRTPAAKRFLRTTLVLLSVTLLHLLAGVWGTGQVGRALPPIAPRIITASLEPAPQAPTPAPERLKPIPKKTPKTIPKPHAKPPTPPISVPASVPDSAPPTNAAQSDWQRAGNDGDGNGNENGGAATASAPADTETAPAPQPPMRARDAPPSATLKYDVQGLRDGQKVYGSGKIVWRNQDGSYRIDGSASVLFFTLLQFSSDGMLDDYGVSPQIYTEKRFRKTPTDTRFEHARNTITFSASDNSYPRPADAQDRASIIWQLATIGRGNPSAFFTGADFSIFVAGVRDAEPWRIIVSGEDEIEAGGGGTVEAWHLVRMPQPGSYDQKIDIWLAPRQEWYPLRIRYTEDNGDYLEMSLSSRTSP